MGIYPFRPKQIAKCPCSDQAKCSCFEIRFNKNQVTCKMLHRTRVSCKFFFLLSFLPDFLKIEFFIKIRFLENQV